jgi:hypothetical protein
MIALAIALLMLPASDVVNLVQVAVNSYGCDL